ncbi:MAG: hypothetical protein ACRD2F_03345 [Terriglobales bacterium]
MRAAGGFPSAVALAVVGLLGLWLATDTRRAVTSLVGLVGVFYFWLPGRRPLFARALERNLRLLGAWRVMGLLIVASYVITLAWLLSMHGASR